MARLSNILRSIVGGCVGFWCPACDQPHVIRVEGNNAWGYNGNVDAPTFTPSILVTGGEFDTKCHSYVTDGKIQYLNDSTHALAGQTLPLVEWPYNFHDGDSFVEQENKE